MVSPAGTDAPPDLPLPRGRRGRALWVGPSRAGSLHRHAAELQESDLDTGGHSRRVSRYATLVGPRLGVTGPSLQRLRTAAMLHDVGKIAVPREILLKPGRLTDAEFELIRRHAPHGGELVDRIVGDAGLSTIVRHHHERIDGGGYPDGLAGDAIPLGARIVAVADTFDAVASRRPYRPAGSLHDALDVILAVAGTQLDPEVVAAFGDVYEVLLGSQVAEIDRRITDSQGGSPAVRAPVA